MNPAYIPLITILISVSASLGGVYMGYKLNKSAALEREEQLSRERVISANFKARQDAYAKVYEELYEYENYFYKFVDYDNEFVEHIDLQKFAPLTPSENFINLYRKHEIWLHESTKKHFQNLFNQASALNNIPLHIASIEYDFIKETQITDNLKEKQEIIDIDLNCSCFQEENNISLKLDVDIEKECHHILNIIEGIRKHIIEVNGIDKLDKLTD